MLDPFAGIGSVPYQAVIMGRRGLGIELKESYFVQAVNNMIAADAEYAARGANADVRMRCPVCGIKLESTVCPICGTEV